MIADDAGAEAPLVFAIPNAHIDPVWIWGWREGMREVVATFESAADRLDENQDLVFVASSAAYYRWVEQMDPALFDRIRQHVATGRWEIVGGQWIEPDCTVPSGESVCRQLLYSQRYFMDAFGRVATVAYNVDSFGHAGSLPQLFHKAGLDSYVFMRPQQHEKSLPASLFAWEGIDGTKLTTYRIHTAYTTSLPPDTPVSDELQAERDLIEARASELVDAAVAEQAPMMLFVGVGDHGGGPTRAAIEKVREIGIRSSGAVAFGSTAAYFAHASEHSALPTVRGDLHMHAVGCYSVVAWIKVNNALAETALMTAEKMAALASMMTGTPLDVRDEVRAAWLRVLFNQFHDSLGGTCTEEVCEELRQFYGYARTLADDVTTRATQLVARRAYTWVDGVEGADRRHGNDPFSAHFPVPVVVFNPLTRPVRTPLVLPHPATSVTTGEAESLPVQRVPSREGTRYDSHSFVVAELPPLGYRVYWLWRDEARHTDDSPRRSPGPPAASAAGDEVRSDSFVVRIDQERGRLVSLVSTPSGREWLAPEGIRPVVLDDPSDTWSHGVARYEGAEQECSIDGVTVVDEGPLRVRTRLTYRWGDSVIYQDVVLYAGMEYLDVVLRVDWRERHKLLKLVLPFAALDSCALTAGLPYGAIQRDADGREEVLQHWIDLAADSDGSGVAISSDFGCAYDATGGRVRMTVLRSPGYSDHGASWVTDDPVEQPATDQGRHEVSYRLRPHDGPLTPAQASRQADEHSTIFPVVTETWHSGPLGPEASAMQVSADNVAVSVLKRAEDGNGWVVRVCETAGQRSEGRIVFGPLDRTWQGTVGRFEVLTLLIPDDAGTPIHEIPLTELQEAGMPPRDPRP